MISQLNRVVETDSLKLVSMADRKGPSYLMVEKRVEYKKANRVF